MKPRARRRAVMRPGPEGWEFWTSRQSAPSGWERQALPAGPVPGLVAALPTRDMVALPLWLPATGNFQELAELELTSRHLLRRGMEVHCLPIETAGGRSLVLALASEEASDSPEALKSAERFEAAARTWPASGADVVIWREGGSFCFALYRGAACVFFAGGTSGARSLCGAVKRALIRLRSEQVIEAGPKLARLYGPFPEDGRRAILDGLGIPLEYCEEPPPPFLPEFAADLPPRSARESRAAGRRRKRLMSIAAAGAAAYAAVAIFFGGTLALDGWRNHRLRNEAASITAPASEAREEITRWREIRSAVDPRLFALDLLAAVAAQLPSDQVRLTIFSIESGRLSIAGEAPDVPLAYAFIENVKQSPALAEFDWTANQLQLAGKQIVRFELEGRLPHAQTVQE